jgi:antitoxin CcdA
MAVTVGKSGRRRSVNLTIREDILADAKSLSLNASQAAEAGIVEAIRQARTQAWRAENRAGIDAHNARVEKDGVLLTPDWASE